MNKTFLATLLGLMCLTQVSFAGIFDKYQYADNGYIDPYYEEEEDKGPVISEEQLTHNSLFWELASGMAAHEVSGYIEPRGESITGGYVDGEGFYGAANLGINFRRWFSIYVGMEFTNGTGYFAYDGNRDKIKGLDYFDFNLHIGTDIFPFRDSDELRGLFFGFEIGIGFVEAYTDALNEYHYTSDVVSDDPVTYKIQVGHLWDLTPHYSLGVKTFVVFDSYDERDYYYDDELTNLSGVAVGIAATLIRR